MNVKDFEASVRLINDFLNEMDPIRRDISNLKADYHDLRCSIEILIGEISYLKERCGCLEKQIIELGNGKKND